MLHILGLKIQIVCLSDNYTSLVHIFPPFHFIAAGSGWSSNNGARPAASVPGEKNTVPPLPTDEDSLVQRAEHIPAGKRTPMCAHCNQVIRFVLPFPMCIY